MLEQRIERHIEGLPNFWRSNTIAVAKRIFSLDASQDHHQAWHSNWTKIVLQCCHRKPHVLPFDLGSFNHHLIRSSNVHQVARFSDFHPIFAQNLDFFQEMWQSSVVWQHFELVDGLHSHYYHLLQVGSSASIFHHQVAFHFLQILGMARDSDSYQRFIPNFVLNRCHKDSYRVVLSSLNSQSLSYWRVLTWCEVWGT